MTRDWNGWTVAVLALVILGLPASVRAEEETKEEHPAGYGKNFHIESADGRFSLDLGARLQFRVTHESPDVGDSKTSFRVRRMKFYMSGHAYFPWLKYKLQTNWAGSSVTLEDAYFDWAKVSEASLRLGQYKVPFGVQELTSSGKQQFVDRSEVSHEFAHGRDIGTMLHGKMGGKRFAYSLGLFNGNGPNNKTNDDSDLLVAGRFEIMPFGEFSKYESSTKNEDLGMLIGLAGMVNTAQDDVDGDETADTIDTTSFEADFSLRWQRISFLADYYSRTVDPDVAGYGSEDSSGLLTQFGVFAIPRKLEFALRYGVIDPTDASDDKRTETRFGVNYFFRDHKYKVQLDYGILEEETGPGSDVSDNEARLQVQVLF